MRPVVVHCANETSANRLGSTQCGFMSPRTPTLSGASLKGLSVAPSGPSRCFKAASVRSSKPVPTLPA